MDLASTGLIKKVVPVPTKQGLVQEDEFLNHSKVTLEGVGVQPEIEADSELPTTAVPVIVGAGLAAKGNPARTTSVFFEATVVTS